jgi:hypothetical protein
MVGSGSASPMAGGAAMEDVDCGEREGGGAAAGGGLAVVEWAGEDRRACDTRLSRAVCDRDAGPRLRSSYSRSVVTTAGLCPHAAARALGYAP